MSRAGVFMRSLGAVLLCGSFAACTHGGARQDLPSPGAASTLGAVIVTDRAQLESAVGKRVTLRGTVENSRVPTLLGVDVESDAPDLRGQAAVATGILKRQVVTQEEIDQAVQKGGQFANRGAGTFYSLVDDSGKVVQVQRP